MRVKLRCFGKSIFSSVKFCAQKCEELEVNILGPTGENFVTAVSEESRRRVFLFKIGTVAIKSGGPDVVEKLWHLERGDCTKQL